jgi:hypothetical protein
MSRQIADSSGRSFTPEEINLISQTAKTFSNLSLTELSKTLCELLEWKRPNGKLKYEECRAFLEHLQCESVVSIPMLRSAGSPVPRHVNISAHAESEAPVSGSVGLFEPLRLKLVRGSDRELIGAFKQLIERWHYLKYHIAFGASARYLVESEKLPGRYLACLQFSSPAWKTAPLDAWIGWSAEQQKLQKKSALLVST